MIEQRPSGLLVAIRGLYEGVCVNPDGSIAWRERSPNGATTSGLNDILQVYFNSGTQKTQWFMGLITQTGFSTLASSDTISSHTGWTESVNYSNGARPQWVPSAASGGIITAGTPCSFNINATDTLIGIFLVSNSTLNGNTGQLYSTALFAAGAQSVVNGQTVQFNFTATFSPTN